MAYEQRDNSGALFVNTKRENDKHPNATGTAMIGGVRYRVSAWTKTRADGSKWQSLAFKVDEHSNPPRERNDNPVADIESDIPF